MVESAQPPFMVPLTQHSITGQFPGRITPQWFPWFDQLVRAVFGITQTFTEQTDIVLGANASAVTTVPFQGVVPTDRITVTLAIDQDGVGVQGYVIAANQAAILYWNVTAGAKTLTAPFVAHLRAVPHNFA